MHVAVVYALPDTQHVVHLELNPGATVAQALEAVRRIEPFASLDLQAASVGVFGRVVDRGRLLEPGDRVEIYRPLMVEPMEARRRRVRQEGGSGP